MEDMGFYTFAPRLVYRRMGTSVVVKGVFGSPPSLGPQTPTNSPSCFGPSLCATLYRVGLFPSFETTYDVVSTRTSCDTSHFTRSVIPAYDLLRGTYAMDLTGLSISVLHQRSPTPPPSSPLNHTFPMSQSPVRVTEDGH